jgi:RimJ/RimL family protein N-acetyltransferase
VTGDFRIRRLVKADAARYVELRREMLADTPVAFLGDLDDDECLDLELMEARLSSSESPIFCAENGEGEFCSVAGFYRDRRAKMRHRGTVWGVFTRPGYRRLGLSRRVLETAVRHASAMEGLELLHLSVSVEAPGAQALYESLGFTAWGREPRAVMVDGRQVDEIHMWRAARAD